MQDRFTNDFEVLIVAKCNVNILSPVMESLKQLVLIVAKCNVNTDS